jgi:hypothetical protein
MRVDRVWLKRQTMFDVVAAVPTFRCASVFPTTDDEGRSAGVDGRWAPELRSWHRVGASAARGAQVAVPGSAAPRTEETPS